MEVVGKETIKDIISIYIMSSNGYNFFINYVKYLLYKHKKKRNIYKEYHEYKIQEIKNIWSKIDRKLEIDDDDYYYAGILLYCLLDNGFKLIGESVNQLLLSKIL